MSVTRPFGTKPVPVTLILVFADPRVGDRLRLSGSRAAQPGSAAPPPLPTGPWVGLPTGPWVGWCTTLSAGGVCSVPDLESPARELSEPGSRMRPVHMPAPITAASRGTATAPMNHLTLDS